MCGIIGVFSKQAIDKLQVKKACEILTYRGPDDSGYYFSDNIALGHRRLSIIDLSRNGKQPMCNKNEDIWIVFNGEIYNFQELRKELRHKYEFKSNTDTEVILHAYEEWGEACVEKFNGMFAFAIYDSKQKKLFLARDRAGVKPLYYYLDKERFIFASEIKALLEFNIPKVLNKDALYDYFNYFIMVGNETLLKGVNTVPPGHYFVLQNNKLVSRKYWDFNYKPEVKTEKAWTELISRQVEESIKMRMIADVKVGAFLSGGVDSSAIAAYMSKFNDKVMTFSVGSGDDTELKNARLVADKLNTEHHEIMISSDDFAKNLGKMIWHYDMPVSFPSSVPLYFVSKLTKGKATVVLTGEGADELFAGYNRYRLLLNAHKGNLLKMIPAMLRNSSKSIIESLYSDPRYRKNFDMLVNGFNFDYATGINILIGKERELLLKAGKNSALRDKVVRIYNEKEAGFLNRILYLDFKTYLVELLMKQDKMSMAASIESREPFLDYRLVELAARIPPELKLKGNIGKYIFKKSLENVLPKEVIYQKKLGFPVPIDAWFKKELSGFVRDNLQHEIVNEFFNHKEVEKLLERNKTKNCSLQLWALLNFKLWHEQFIS